MDVLRRNTDYALRMTVNLASHYGNEPVSARKAAQQGDVPYQLTCKILQRLNNARLVKSSMGAKGGFRLSREPSKITVLQVIEAIQGPLRLNRCLLSTDACPRQRSCAVKVKMAKLQKSISSYLGGITLDKLTRSNRAKTKNIRRKR
jgi:Rrf2 family protein